jgi:Flp pilus assembly pilin Flp
MSFLQRENAQALVEYAVILVFVTIVVIAVLTLLGESVSGIFSHVTEALQGGVDPSEPPPEPEKDCYGSLLLPYLVGVTGLSKLLLRLVPNRFSVFRE